MPGCCAVGCTNRDSKGFLMKRFPRDPVRRKLWACKVKRENWSPKDSTYICEMAASGIERDNADRDADKTDVGSSSSTQIFLPVESDDQEKLHELGSEVEESEKDTNEEIETEAEELEAATRRRRRRRRRRRDKQRSSQRLVQVDTEEQLKQRLEFYKFTGLYVSKLNSKKLCVDLTPTFKGKRLQTHSYYIIFRVLQDNCFQVAKKHLPYGVLENLSVKKVTLDALGDLLGYLRLVCECAEVKMKQFTEAEEECVSEAEESRNVKHTVFVYDNLHVEIVFRPRHRQQSEIWLIVFLLYNDREIFYEPGGIKVQSKGFSESVEEKVRDIFMESDDQDLKIPVWKSKRYISLHLEDDISSEESSRFS